MTKEDFLRNRIRHADTVQRVLERSLTATEIGVLTLGRNCCVCFRNHRPLVRGGGSGGEGDGGDAAGQSGVGTRDDEAGDNDHGIVLGTEADLVPCASCGLAYYCPVHAEAASAIHTDEACLLFRFALRVERTVAMDPRIPVYIPPKLRKE